MSKLKCGTFVQYFTQETSPHKSGMFTLFEGENSPLLSMPNPKRRFCLDLRVPVSARSAESASRSQRSQWLKSKLVRRFMQAHRYGSNPATSVTKKKTDKVGGKNNPDSSMKETLAEGSNKEADGIGTDKTTKDSKPPKQDDNASTNATASKPLKKNAKKNDKRNDTASTNANTSTNTNACFEIRVNQDLGGSIDRVTNQHVLDGKGKWMYAKLKQSLMRVATEQAMRQGGAGGSGGSLKSRMNSSGSGKEGDGKDGDGKDGKSTGQNEQQNAFTNNANKANDKDKDKGKDTSTDSSSNSKLRFYAIEMWVRSCSSAEMKPVACILALAHGFVFHDVSMVLDYRLKTY